MKENKDMEDEIQHLFNKYNQQERLPSFLSRMIVMSCAAATLLEKEKGDAVEFIQKCVSKGIFQAEDLIKVRKEP